MNVPAPESPPSFAPPKKRAWFQLHLSTCVVLMLAASALVWANVHSYTVLREPRRPFGVSGFYVDGEAGFECRGWPWPHQDAYTQYDERNGRQNKSGLLVQFSDEQGQPGWSYPLEDDIWRNPESWDKTHLAYNVIVALALLVVSVCGSEWFSRRRERWRGGHCADSVRP